MGSSVKAITGAAVIGGAAGAAAGLMMAPKRGSEMRDDLRYHMKKAKRKGEDVMYDVKGKAKENKEKVQGKGQSLAERAKDVADELAEQAKDKAND